jgi:hypothetical protein
MLPSNQKTQIVNLSKEIKMKNIIYKIFLLLALALFATNVTRAQLPLIYGDAVASHSPSYNYGPMDPNSFVLKTIKTNDTQTAPLGVNWNTPTMLPPGTKPANWSAANWTYAKLGIIFGITLDKEPLTNIYVSNTQIFSGSNQNTSKVWRLDNTTGAHTLVFDFLNTTRSLGNLKYQKIGITNNIYVSNWDNGSIERLTGNPAGTALWTKQNAFNPKFAATADDPISIPYGLAIRKILGVYRLYYAKIRTAVPYSTNEIYSVQLDANGDFLPLTEQLETTPAVSTLQPIADIAFSEDGNRMLIAQQTWYSFGALGAHDSKVVEFLSSGPASWISSASLFPSGGFSSKTNATGGVSYSNNVFKGSSTNYSCDSSVWFTSDALNSSVTLYGVEGYSAAGGTVPNSILIDYDDSAIQDKSRLGDIEVYKKPLECNPCSCGEWQGGPTLGGNPIPGVPIILHPDFELGKAEQKIVQPGSIGNAQPIQLPLNYPLQFIQGNVSGLINAVYNCNGNCGATYTWQLTAASGVLVANGTTLPVDLAQYNAKLTCGKYTLTIKAKCGNSDCGSLTIPITIICEPPSCCKAEIKIEQTSAAFNVATNLANPNAFSTGTATFSIFSTTPMSEVRVSVEEFRLIASSPNCLNCNNRPVTWGNILSASLNAQPMTLSGYVGPVTGSIAADYREAVLNNNAPISLNPGNFNIKLSLPTITELTCCEVKVYLCLKFTFKDANCNECVQMVCGQFALNPPKDTHGDVASPIKNSNIKTFKVEH